MFTPTAEIRQALYKRLLEGLPLWNMERTDVAWPNTEFKPRISRVYLKPDCLYNDTESVTLSATGFEKLEGVFQISIYGIINKGEREIESLAAAIVDHFRAGNSLDVECANPLLITKCWRGGMRIVAGADGGGASRPLIPVSAIWEQYTQKGE